MRLTNYSEVTGALHHDIRRLEALSFTILYYPTNAQYIICRYNENYKIFKSAPNMFRITEDPSSGSLVQCLAKNYMDKVGVMAAYSDPLCVCVVHCI